MFLKILLQTFTFYLFAGGFVLTFIIMIILKSPIFNCLWVGFIGGVVLCGIWGFCIQLLSFLLSERELAKLFRLPLPEGLADAFNEEDNDDDLTLSDLYNPDDGDPIDDDNDDDDDEIGDDSSSENHKNATDPPPFSDAFLSSGLDDLESSEEIVASSNLDSDGKFKITAAGKTLKASPQDGAQAVRKVLSESELESGNEY